ncbi:MAG: deoxynucleoside kinase [Marinilabiliales bacterium]|nr:deoxynucleoside kinase [Marinilabiliales bacterium]
MVYHDFLVIEGNIGAGKTTFAKSLGEETDARIILEQFADNPFLPKFYKDPEKYSFALELSFLAERYGQLNRELANRDLFHNHTISDYYFMKSLIFAQNTLAQDEYNLYRNFFDIIYERLPKPDLFVYLHLPEEKLIENIRKRGRDYEQSIEADYLRKIREGYFTFFAQMADFPVLLIDTSSLDFVKYRHHFDLLRDLILSPVDWTGIKRVILKPDGQEIDG